MDVCDLDKVSSTAIIHYLSQKKKKKTNKKIKRLQRVNWRLKNIFCCKIFYDCGCCQQHSSFNSAGGTMQIWLWCWTWRLELVILRVKKQHDHFISLSGSHVTHFSLSFENIPETFYPFFGCLLFELQWFVRCAHSPCSMVSVLELTLPYLLLIPREALWSSQAQQDTEIVFLKN